MVQDTFSGVELLALYGDTDSDDRITGEGELGFSFRRGIRKVGSGLKTAAKYTPHYQAYRGAKWGVQKAGKYLRRMRGEDNVDYYLGDDGDVYMMGDDNQVELLGKVGPGLKKFGRGFKKIGKVTSGLTTGIARAVGIPQSVIDAASKFDPTKKGTSAKGAVVAITPKPAQKTVVRTSKEESKLNFKNIALVAGAGAAGLIILKVALGSRK